MSARTLCQDASVGQFLGFLNKSTSPYHAVASCEDILSAVGFKEVKGQNRFPDLEPLGKYYVKKNDSSIFAFAVGGKYVPGKGGFSAVMAHTDSPCLRLKPVSKKGSERFVQVGVCTYGGGLWRTWFDRDLSVAGQVVFFRNGQICHKLIDLGRERPVMSIPSLAIHLETASEREKFDFNKETHLRPILAHENTNLVDKKGQLIEAALKNYFITGDHNDELLGQIAALAGCQPEDILDLDLCLYDVQPAVLSGIRGEFISGARLDNLVGTYTAIRALVESVGSEAFANDPNIRLVACFDHEEVGSQSTKGAASAFTEQLLRRLAKNPEDAEAFECAVGRSMIISADQTHSVHPNYGHKHDEAHKPAFHGGVVVKINVNQHYATSAITHSVLKVIADAAKVPLQKVVVKNDSPCGSTVGPILATKLGIQTIDVGCPQLAMHSIRELADASSIPQAIRLYKTYFDILPGVLRSVKKAE